MKSDISFSSLLINELRDLNLLPSFYEYAQVNNAVISQGRKELSRFRKTIGTSTWWKGFIATRQWYFNYSGIAGWGYYLSTYINAPLKLSSSENDVVGHLSSLSSIIITLYDFFLDKKVFRDPPISLSWLEDILQNGTGFHTNNERNTSSAGQLLYRLIELYLAEIYKLPHIEKYPQIMAHLKKSILKMYQAENKTVLRLPDDISKYELIRKSALPFILMGLTGWLASSCFDKSLYDWHLRWLYNIGSFFSLIDDTVDLHLDRSQGYPNMFIHHIHLDSTNEARWARIIAHKGKDLHVQWWQRVYGNRKVPSHVSMILPSCLASWFIGH